MKQAKKGIAAAKKTPEKERTLVSFDWAIKHILRDKANFDVLEGFLSALLLDEIEVLALLESESNATQQDDHYNRVDLMVKGSDDVHFIIEVQYTHATDYLRRLLFGSAKLITENLQAGHPYQEVKKVVSISLLYFLLGEEGEQENDYVYHGKTEFFGLTTGKRMKVRQDDLKSNTESKSRTVRQWGSEEETGRAAVKNSNIFPEYYLIEVERFPNVVKSALDEWIYFFKHSEIPVEFQAKNIQTARSKLNVLKMSEEERRAYERFLHDRVSHQSEIESAKIAGKIEGKIEGIAEGEQSKAVGIARQMLSHGEPIAKIQLYTGLNEAEIEQIRAQ